MPSSHMTISVMLVYPIECVLLTRECRNKILFRVENIRHDVMKMFVDVRQKVDCKSVDLNIEKYKKFG